MPETHLTDTGREAPRTADAAAVVIERGLADAFPPGERDTLRDLLARFTEAIQTCPTHQTYPAHQTHQGRSAHRTRSAHQAYRARRARSAAFTVSSALSPDTTGAFLYIRYLKRKYPFKIGLQFLERLVRAVTETLGTVGELLGDLAILGLAIAAVYVFVRLARRILASRPPEPRVHETPPDPTWQSRPRPGDIWWAGVPFSDGTGAKVRPCLVIRTHSKGVEVLKITSQDKSHRMNCVSIPTAHWDKRARKDSWLDLDAPYLIDDHDFRRRAGTCDDRTWSLVRRRYRTGWVYSPDR